MSESFATRAVLQRRIDRLSRPSNRSRPNRIATGHAEIDQALGGGLARGRLHEIVAAAADDAASAAGFVTMCGRLLGGTLVWLRVEGQGGGLYPLGLSEVGVDPATVLLVMVPDADALLRAAGEAVRCAAVATVVVELWRDPHRIDLTASRRLVLAAEQSGTTPLLLRIAATPGPSAANTRWGVTAAPSAPMAANAPGAPAFELELLRQRGGPAGRRWRVEWNRDDAEFRPSVRGDLAALSGGGSTAAELRRAVG